MDLKVRDSVFCDIRMKESCDEALKTNNKMRHFVPRTVGYPASRRGSVGKQIRLSTAALVCRTLMDTVDAASVSMNVRALSVHVADFWCTTGLKIP